MKKRAPGIALVGTLKIVGRRTIIAIGTRIRNQIAMRPNGLRRTGGAAVQIDRLEEAGIRRRRANTLKLATIRTLAKKIARGQVARAVGILGLQHRGNVAVGRVEHAIAFAVGCVEAGEETQVLSETGVDMRRRKGKIFADN